MRLSLSRIVKTLKSPSKVKEAQVTGICTDSRNVKKGDLFFAIIAANDGHDYVGTALENGAVAAVVQKDVAGIGEERLVRVADTKEALLQLAAYYYKGFSVKSAAVTGSNGKTTTKELLSACLAAKYATHRSVKSFNNYLGVPLTVLGLDPAHKALVLEIGMNHKGEIKKLITPFPVDAAVITNVGKAHMGFFKDGEKGIARSKAEIMDGVKRGGCVIINRDDRYYGYLRQKVKDRRLHLITFGLDNEADVRITKYRFFDNRTQFTALIEGREYGFSFGLKGTHNLYNASAAIAAAVALGVEPALLPAALKGFKLEGFMRYEEKRMKNGVLLINDCYNANPDSFSASIETLKRSHHRNLVVLMGDMNELGAQAAKYHRETGGRFKGLGIKRFFIYGKYAKYVKEGYGRAAKTYTDRNRLAADLKTAVGPGCTLFVKGSRGNKLEEILAAVF
ncbi:MAG: UDP-N-acetylmuramoyl-tripeptide--D-alanyl-D-alanine ligase [Spirochaetia bacterium]|nr:UDP-N-acetylmuramoyl-tripeptide--D-alanyl-D-alanine ligase [Spirochaetia bacterium]